MKKLFLFWGFLMLFFTVNAQLSKGVWLIGGNGSLYTYNEDYKSPQSNFTARYTTIDISPSVGYFFIDKFSGGLRPTFSYNKGEVIDGGKTNSYQLALGPFLRYYFLKEDKPFNLLADVCYQLGQYNRLGAIHEHGKFNSLSVMGGSEVFFNSAVGIEILLGYVQQIKSIDNSGDGSFNSNKRGLRVSVGFQFHLEKL